jgi:hypothetical protein
MMPARDGRSLAADPPRPEAKTEPAAKKVEPARAKPARAAAVLLQAAHVAAVPAQPAAKRGNLVDAIVKAFGGDNDANQRRIKAAQDQNLKNMEAAYRPQFQQMLYGELALLRRSCKPDAKLFVDVAKAAQAGIHAPLREYVTAMNAPRMVINGRLQAQAGTDDPRLAIKKMLTPLAEAKLGPEKARLYRQECDKRTEARKHATVLNLVAAMDGRLVLTSQQRAKLVESLSAKYDNSWEQFYEVYGGFDNYFPSLPDLSILPLLDEKQKSVWQETAKLSGQMFFGMVFRNNQFGEADEIQEIAHMVEDVKDDQ